MRDTKIGIATEIEVEIAIEVEIVVEIGVEIEVVAEIEAGIAIAKTEIATRSGVAEYHTCRSGTPPKIARAS